MKFTKRRNISNSTSIHLRTAGVPLLLSLAEEKASEGKWEESLLFYNETLRQQRERYGYMHPKVARTLNDVGVVMTNLGPEYRVTALSAFRDALLMQRRLLPKGDRETAITAKNMTMLMELMTQNNAHNHNIDNNRKRRSRNMFRRSKNDVV